MLGLKVEVQLHVREKTFRGTGVEDDGSLRDAEEPSTIHAVASVARFTQLGVEPARGAIGLDVAKVPNGDELDRARRLFEVVQFFLSFLLLRCEQKHQKSQRRDRHDPY